MARQGKNKRDEFSDLSFIPVLSPTNTAKQMPEGRQPWTRQVLAVCLLGHRVHVMGWGCGVEPMHRPNNTDFPSPTTAECPDTTILLCPHSRNLTTV